MVGNQNPTVRGMLAFLTLSTFFCDTASLHHPPSFTCLLLTFMSSLLSPLPYHPLISSTCFKNSPTTTKLHSIFESYLSCYSILEITCEYLIKIENALWQFQNRRLLCEELSLSSVLPYPYRYRVRHSSEAKTLQGRCYINLCVTLFRLLQTPCTRCPG